MGRRGKRNRKRWVNGETWKGTKGVEKRDELRKGRRVREGKIIKRKEQNKGN